MGSDQRARVRITILLSRKLPSEVQENVCICTVLHECISTICTSWAAPSGSEVKQSFSTIQALKEEEETRKGKKRKEKKRKKNTKKQKHPHHCNITQPNLSVMAICRITRPKTNTSSPSSSKACYNRDPYQSLGFAPTPLCAGMQGCTFAIPLCCWKKKSWKHVSWHVMVFQCIVTILLTDSCLAGCPKLTFEYSVESCILFVRACVCVWS